jgi:hypothetical protein
MLEDAADRRGGVAHQDVRDCALGIGRIEVEKRPPDRERHRPTYRDGSDHAPHVVGGGVLGAGALGGGDVGNRQIVGVDAAIADHDTRRSNGSLIRGGQGVEDELIEVDLAGRG